LGKSVLKPVENTRSLVQKFPTQNYACALEPKARTFRRQKSRVFKGLSVCELNRLVLIAENREVEVVLMLICDASVFTVVFDYKSRTGMASIQQNGLH
jgi:hypothetical protein